MYIRRGIAVTALAVLLISSGGYSQRKNIGIYMSLPGLGFPTTMKIDQDYIFPEHSYKAFYIQEKKQRSRGFNNLSIGMQASLDYRLLSLSMAGSYSTREAKYEIQYPTGNGEFVNYCAKITLQGIEIPVSLSYVLINGRKLIFRINAGISNNLLWGSERSSGSGSDLTSPYVNIFEGIVYKRNLGYCFKTTAGFSFGFRFMQVGNLAVGPVFERYSPAPGVIINSSVIQLTFLLPLKRDKSQQSIYIHEE